MRKAARSQEHPKFLVHCVRGRGQEDLVIILPNLAVLDQVTGTWKLWVLTNFEPTS